MYELRRRYPEAKSLADIDGDCFPYPKKIEKIVKGLMAINIHPAEFSLQPFWIKCGALYKYEEFPILLAEYNETREIKWEVCKSDGVRLVPVIGSIYPTEQIIQNSDDLGEFLFEKSRGMDPVNPRIHLGVSHNPL